MPASNDSNTSSRPPVRVLYVDDEPTLRFVVAQVLRASGHLVETASDGADGLRQLTEALTNLRTPFDLLITDLDMPAMDGVTLIRMLRKAKLPIRVVVYSSALSPRRIEQLNILSVDAVIEKGSPPRELLETITKLTSACE